MMWRSARKIWGRVVTSRSHFPKTLGGSPREGAEAPAESAPPAPAVHRLPLTCAGAPVVGLAHPVVALAQGPEVHAGLRHVANADPAVAPAAAVAQSAPWGLPGRPAAALRLRPGQPASGPRPAPARAANHSGATVRSRHGPPSTLSACFPPSAHSWGDAQLHRKEV